MGMGIAYRPAYEMAPLKLERGGVNVPPWYVDAYHELIPLLKAHARGGYTWASPDAPEVYFLADLRNPTRSLYEFFEDPSGYDQRTLALLDAHGVTAVVINRLPSFSREISKGMNREILSRYPESRTIGPFEVRWRE